MKKPHTNSEGTKPEPAASGPCAFPYAEIPQTDEQLPPEPENPGDMIESARNRLYDFAAGWLSGEAAEEVEAICRELSRAQAALEAAPACPDWQRVEAIGRELYQLSAEGVALSPSKAPSRVAVDPAELDALGAELLRLANVKGGAL